MKTLFAIVAMMVLVLVLGLCRAGAQAPLGSTIVHVQVLQQTEQGLLVKGSGLDDKTFVIVGYKGTPPAGREFAAVVKFSGMIDFNVQPRAPSSKFKKLQSADFISVPTNDATAVLQTH